MSLIVILIDEIVQKLQKNIDMNDSAFKKIELFIYGTYDFFESDIRVGSLLFMVGPLRTVLTSTAFQKSAWNKMLIDIFSEGQKSGEVRTDIDVIMMMDTVYALLQRQFQMWMIRKKPRHLTDVVDDVSEIIFNAFRKEAEEHRWIDCKEHASAQA
jgi:hypothetical protein